jgi:hydrogenase expression/formation protein HypE
VLKNIQQHPLGKDAKTIGEVITGEAGLVLLETMLGARRILGMLEGEHLPRIC